MAHNHDQRKSDRNARCVASHPGGRSSRADTYDLPAQSLTFKWPQAKTRSMSLLPSPKSRFRGLFRSKRNAHDVGAIKALFDADWYLNAYTDVRGVGMDPFDHFLRHGLMKGASRTSISIRHGISIRTRTSRSRVPTHCCIMSNMAGARVGNPALHSMDASICFCMPTWRARRSILCGTI